MDNKITELREKQQFLGHKINMFHETQKRKEEEAEKIRELIAECRENLNRIKKEAIVSNHQEVKGPSNSLQAQRDSTDAKNTFNRPNPCLPGPQPDRTLVGKTKNDSVFNCDSINPSQEKKRKSFCERKEEQDPCSKYLTKKTTERNSSIESKISALAEIKEKSMQCIDSLGEKMEKEIKMKVMSESDNPCLSLHSPRESSPLINDVPCQERVSCRVDLRNLKINIRGSPQDLKNLDAVQLINLLDKFQCQELVINTSNYQDQQGTPIRTEVRSGTGEVPIFHILHPGNLVLIVGVAMIAFLLNTNLCSTQRECRTRFFLNMLYLGSFAFHYGIVLWMSFIRGLTLSAGLSPEVFNTVDNLILPKYFSICVFLSAITLYSFLATHCDASCNSWPLPVLVQVIIESSTFLTELVAICYIVPAIVKLRKATDEFLKNEQASLWESYCKNVKKLAKLNWAITLINTLTAMLMGANIYYVSTKLNIS